ncbi:chemotaxis protein CheW [Aeromonas hydrophila]|uniref:chemotaxis protein CheW n=1 Tax=Aeromonas hydrophila TaxID=644 RepID=UPI001932248F|nr:chemotaxis protein CheW [Aeromonas hydrophila]MBM0512364.1 chemotaxis protein CheW [Aeromonas hydrophila]MBQ4676040.1 chemotaxis protein CheW [Aeromonas hydrophila]MBW3772102.1 chemotaxis protein CheW [Aeromonas hydrophila]MBW3814201.1 chemotaxis protein CheW [Aeromonas hydrophila]MCF7681100.1 chemotaxis protein CheW [Aeromonas hydrophila]
MRDTTQVRAMDDYFHSLLLDDALLLDSSDEPDSAPVIQLQRQPQPVVDKVAQPYLEADQRLEQLSELLAQVGQVQFEIDALSHEEVVSEPLQIEAEDALLPVEPVWPEVMPEPAAADPATLVVTETDVALTPQEKVAPSTWENIDTGKEFQALFFEVAGVTFAVPLTELGGIHQLGEVNTLFGQPGWYKGIMTSREQKMNVVDTAQWVMPGQHLEVPDYKYLIMLGESPWGLACHHLKGTELLHRDQVKWRHQEGKRPWLAGMVKEKMCALLHVKELLLLLERGVNIEGR